MEPRPEDRGRWALAIGASAVFFVLYLRRLCPTLSLTGDSAELVAAGAVWGVPHAPGYPLFTALAHAFTWIPLHEIAWRVHLTSAVFHAATVGATVLATLAISKSRLAALAAGVALGLERSFLAGSLYAEVFPLNDLFFAALLLLAIRLREGRTSPLVFAVTASLAASHHMMIALAAPALAILVYRPLKEHRGRLVLAAAFVVPFALAYALVPLAAARDPAVSWGDVHDARSFVRLLTREDYGGLFSSVHGAGHGTGPERVAALGRLLAGGFGPFTLLFAGVGAVDLLRRQTLVGVSLVVAAFATGPLFAWLNALGTASEEGLAFFARFSTMCTVPIAISFGAGVAAAIRLSSSSFARVTGSVALAGWAALCVLRVGGVDLSNDRRGIAFAHDLVLRAPDRALLLLSGDAAGGAALYVCAIEERCGDRVPLSPGSLFMPWAMAQARRRHPEIDIPWTDGPALKRTHELAAAEVSKRPVFVSPDLLEKDPLLASTFTPVPDHLLFRLWPPGTDPLGPTGAFLRSARAMAGDDAAACEGCALAPPAEHPTQEVEIALAYAAASFNHARTASGLPEARDLALRLLARSGEYAQRGGASMSRNISSSSR